MAIDDVALTEDEYEQARTDREGLLWLSEFERSTLETVQPTGTPSSTPISGVAFELIVEFEVSSERVYSRRYRGPIWPGGASGVTIGIGYDVGYANEPTLAADFGGSIPGSMIDVLQLAIGKRGATAEQLVRDMANRVDVPWTAAISIHKTKVMPRWIGLVERALPNTADIGPDCLGALVSLTYNRGASYPNAGARYAEMRAIRTHMAAREFDRIPGDLRSMKRLWPNVPGLQKRREREATLFEDGLRAV